MNDANNGGWGQPPAQNFAAPVAAPNPEEWTAPTAEETDALLLVWENAKKAVEAAKLAEIEARNAFIKRCTDPTKREGTERVELGNGYYAAVGKKLNYKLRNEEGQAERAEEQMIALAKKKGFEQAGFIAERLFKWDVELSITEYRLVQDGIAKRDPMYVKIGEILGTTLEVKDAQASLEIRAPKKKG